MTETSTKKEIENLQDEIREKSDELDVNIQKLRNPRLVLFNIPEDITLGNVEETLTCQNPEQDINPLNAELNPICHLLALLGGATIVVISRLRVKAGDIKAKFSYNTKRGTRNLVIEVDPSTRKKLMTARIKLGWTIGRVDDYIVAKMCYRCSRYNHTFRECKREETCPLCSGGHRLKDCTTTKAEYKCVNCTTYNQHNHTTQNDTAHSSLGRKCPSLRAVLEK